MIGILVLWVRLRVKWRGIRMSGWRVWIRRRKWNALKMTLGLVLTPHVMYLLCHDLVGDTKAIEAFVEIERELVLSLWRGLMWCGLWSVVRRLILGINMIYRWRVIEWYDPLLRFDWFKGHDILMRENEVWLTIKIPYVTIDQVVDYLHSSKCVDVKTRGPRGFFKWMGRKMKPSGSLDARSVIKPLIKMSPVSMVVGL